MPHTDDQSPNMPDASGASRRLEAPPLSVESPCLPLAGHTSLLPDPLPGTAQRSSSRALRICILAFVVPQHGIGGMQDHTRELAQGLVRAGHEVEVVTSRHPEGLRDETLNGVRYVFVDAPRHHLHPVWLRESYAEFVRLHAHRRFDVVHSESSSGLELVRRGVHRQMPVVVQFHGNFLSLAKANLRSGLRTRRPLPVLRSLRAVQWLAAHDHFRAGNWHRFRACEAIVPSRNELNDTYRSHLLERSRVHVVPYGIDVRLFHPQPHERARAQLDLGDGPLFACVGRLSREKGNHRAVQALASLDAYPSARLVVVGGGEEREALSGLAARLGLERRVLFVGDQPHEIVAAYLAAADVFLFPTERAEALGLVLLQAMACARPVVASRIGAIPEVVDRPGENGLLVPPGDLEALTNAMRQLLSDEGLRSRLGHAARERVLAEYTVERMVERTLAVYEVARQRQAIGHSRA